MFGENADFSFLRVIGSRAFVHEGGHRDKLDQRAWEGVLEGYNNDSPTYRIYDSTNGKIVSSCNVTSIKCVESNTPSMVVDIDEGCKSSDDLENENEYDGIQNVKTTGSYNVGDDNAVKKQDDTLTLRFIEKSNREITGEKTMNYSFVNSQQKNN